ncbi:MAG: (2Fe-2S)-binding protein [Micromonosporaceae bacterium]
MPPPDPRPAAAAETAPPAVPFTVTVDGQPVDALPGQTIAAVLLSAGRRVTRRTRVSGRPRGPFCGIGFCFDCLVVCNGEPGVRACLRPVAPGDVILTEDRAEEVRW